MEHAEHCIRTSHDPERLHETAEIGTYTLLLRYVQKSGAEGALKGLGRVAMSSLRLLSGVALSATSRLLPLTSATLTLRTLPPPRRPAAAPARPSLDITALALNVRLTCEFKICGVSCICIRIADSGLRLTLVDFALIINIT